MSEARGTYEITVGGVTQSVTVRRTAREDGLSAYVLQVGEGPERTVEADSPSAGVLSLLSGGRSVEAGLVPLEDGFEVDILGTPHEVTVLDPRSKALKQAAGAGGAVLKTQMPGRIVSVLCEPGQAVTKGEPLVVIEAMKMENELKATQDGTVAKVLVSVGDLVEARTVLVELG